MVQVLQLKYTVSTMSGHSRPSSKGKEVYSHSLTDSKGQVQNVKAARVYVFSNDSVYEDDENEKVEFEMPEIRARRGQGQGDASTFAPAEEEESFFEKEISDGETLQSLSLKYACPVSKLRTIFFVSLRIKLQNLKIDLMHVGNGRESLRVVSFPAVRHCGYETEPLLSLVIWKANFVSLCTKTLF